jgi:rhomboid family protein
MMSRVFSSLASVRVTAAYAATLVLVATTLLALGPRAQDSVVSRMSTNLHNLGHGRVGTLVGSAFVTADGHLFVVLPGLVCLLALAELLWQGRRLILAFALGHIGATLVVAAGLATAIRLGWLPISVTRASDVGISYGAAAVLGALTAAIPARWRPAWIGWWLAIALLAAASGEDFTPAGHTVALALGMLLSTRFGSAARWTPVRLALLAVGAAFGYMFLTELSLLMAPVAGLAGVLIALIGGWAQRRWRIRRAAAETSAAPDAKHPLYCKLGRE